MSVFPLKADVFFYRWPHFHNIFCEKSIHDFIQHLQQLLYKQIIVKFSLCSLDDINFPFWSQ